MRIAIVIGCCALFILASSCCTDPSDVHTEAAISDTLDTAEMSVIIDTMLSDTGQYVDEISETESLIAATYGEQWEFCDCVLKNDSVNKAVEIAESDADYERVLARMDEIDKHCKAMLAMPNTTPEEREKHERKVNKCLKNR